MTSIKALHSRIEEPSMSDKTLVLNIEDLIGLTFGPSETNTANFKMMQTVLHLLARQMRLLQQDVEIRFAEEEDRLSTQKKRGRHDRHVAISSRQEVDSEGEESDMEETPYYTSTTEEVHGDKRKGKIESKFKTDKMTPDHHAMAEDRPSTKDGGNEGKKKKDKKGATHGKGEMADESSSPDEPGARKKGDVERKSKSATENLPSPDDLKDSRGTKGKKRGKSKKGEMAVSSSDDDKLSDSERTKKGKKAEGREGIDKKGEKSKDGSREGVDSKGRKTKTDESIAPVAKGRKHKGIKKTKDEFSSSDTTYKTQSPSQTGLTISEVVRKRGKGAKDTVLIVEKGPTTRVESHTRLGNIDVVTRSQFNLLKSDVKALLKQKDPMATFKMPSNKKFKSELIKGTATLPGAMEAMHIQERVKTAEKALRQMAELLTKLAAAGAFPPEMSDLLAEMQEERQEVSRVMPSPAESIAQAKSQMAKSAMSTVSKPAVSRKSVYIDPKSKISTGTSRMERPPQSSMSVATVKSRISTIGRQAMDTVKRSDMAEAIEAMKLEVTKAMKQLTAKSTSAADHARNLANAIEEKLEVALDVDKRINALTSLAMDYAEQLSGFDSGLTIQLQSFHEQMAQIQTELKDGLETLDVSGKTESLAVTELKYLHTGMNTTVEEAVDRHTTLVEVQEELTKELKNQLECMETLREQKADRDEVVDGLRDKADLNRLEKLLHENAFDATRKDLCRRFDTCYEKFKKQDNVWVNALKDLTQLANQKAEHSQYYKLRDSTAEQIMEMREILRHLEIMLGEPKAAIATRHLSHGPPFDEYMLPQMMEPYDKNYDKPPSMVHDHGDEETPCLKDIIKLRPTAERRRICKRWVGGSHTMLTEYTTHEGVPLLELQKIPTKQYCDYGLDGRLYILEEELQPCIECNKLPRDD